MARLNIKTVVVTGVGLLVALIGLYVWNQPSQPVMKATASTKPGQRLPHLKRHQRRQATVAKLSSGTDTALLLRWRICARSCEP
jgi:hypothetical protein